ncbi:transposase [Streptomyces sp. NPDC004111]|uniref:transposase n=1 Tax=Streptomyces sp. NPDC004111 TaxID=3364690 RepID=UPI0036A55CEB
MPLLPQGKKQGRPPIRTVRQLIDGVRFRTRTGVPGRDLPERCQPWARSYDLLRRWQRDGTRQRLFSDLQVQADARDLFTWDLSVDSTVCGAHQYAAGARRRGISRPSRPVGSPSNRTATVSGARAAV